MLQSRAFRIGCGILLLFLIIYVGMRIDFVFRPVILLIQTLFFPFLLSGVLYYLFRPLVNFLELKNVPRGLSILLIYLFAGILIALLVQFVGPILQKQTNRLLDSIPGFLRFLQAKMDDLQHNEWFSRLQGGKTKAPNIIPTDISTIGTNLMSLIGKMVDIVTILASVPFILFYMLKEGERAHNHILRILPETQRMNGRKILADLDEALSAFIHGQILVSTSVGGMLFLGYLIIGLDYSLLLAIFAMFTNVIPFLGPIIATIPAVIVGMLHSPMMLIKVLVVMVVVQQIEGHLISPQVMGKKLEIHPLTIISLLLAAGSIGGVLGLVLAVPVYAVMKVVVQHAWRLWRLRKEHSMEEKMIKGDMNNGEKSNNDAIF